MRINELQNGQTVRARWGRSWHHGDKHGIGWCEWQQISLCVLRTKDGHVCSISINDEEWTDYDPRCDLGDIGEDGHHTLVAEDYYLQIEGLTL